MSVKINHRHVPVSVAGFSHFYHLSNFVYFLLASYKLKVCQKTFSGTTAVLISSLTLNVIDNFGNVYFL